MNTSTPNYDDEIDLFELFLTLWKGKWKIASWAFLCVIIGFGFIKLSKDTFTATLEISPVSFETIAQFETLNSINDPRDPTSSKAIFNFNQEYLLDQFFDVLLFGTHLETILENSAYMDIEFASNIERADAMETLLGSFSFSKPNPEKNEIGKIVFAGVNNEEYENILQKLLIDTKNLTHKETLSQVQRKANGIEQAMGFQIENLKSKREQMIKLYQIKTSDRIAFLNEQAQIARSLDIDKIAFSSGVAIVTNVNAENASQDDAQPYYLRGFHSIEQEIQLLENRTNIEAFVPDLRKIDAEIIALEQSKFTSQLNEAIDTSPLAKTDMFTAARYDLRFLDITYDKKPTLIIALSLVIGIFIGCAHVLVTAAVSRNTKTIS